MDCNRCEIVLEITMVLFCLPLANGRQNKTIVISNTISHRLQSITISNTISKEGYQRKLKRVCKTLVNSWALWQLLGSTVRLPHRIVPPSSSPLFCPYLYRFRNYSDRKCVAKHDVMDLVENTAK